RELSIQGKSSARVDGQLVNLTMLREIGEGIVNLHRQHEHQSLLRTDKHLYWLDQYGIGKIEALKRKYKETSDAYTSCFKELEALRSGIQQPLRMGDLYRFQAEEIGSAMLQAGEDEKL